MTPAFEFQLGPVRVACLPHAPRVPAEPVAREWLALRTGDDPAALVFERGAHGRPDLTLPGLDCNWSHSGPWLLVALGHGVRVGVDIEVHRPRPRALDLARRYFHTDEADALAGLPPEDREHAFLQLWCAKEAVLKAHGRGLAFGLDRVRVGIEDGRPRLAAMDPMLGDMDAWSLHGFDTGPATAAIAWFPDGD